jgi:serine/threonine protein kinase
VSRKAGLPDTGMSGKIAGYRVERDIGHSDMAAVYLARDERLDRQVALKVLVPELADDAAFRTRLLNESRAAADLRHPHIIPVYEAGDAGGILYVAMRYVPGGDTRSLLSRLGPLPFAAASDVITQVASALDAAHAHGLIHCDVKPANMLLETGSTSAGTVSADSAAGDSTQRQADGRTGHVYLADFGMGTDTPPGEVMTTGQFTKTFDYVAPEQIQGRDLDGRTDLYSLACAGFELLCGTPLFEQDQGLTVMYAQLYVPPPSAKARRHDLPAAVDQVLATALAKNPADRYATCTLFAEELAAALGLARAPGPAAAPGRAEAPELAGQPASSTKSRQFYHAGPAPESDPEAGPGPEAEPEVAHITASAPSRPDAPQTTDEQTADEQTADERTADEQTAPGPDQLSPEPASEPDPQLASRRRGVISVNLAVVAAAITVLAIIGTVAIGVAAPKVSAPQAPAVSRAAAASVPSPTPSATPPTPSPATSASASASSQAAALDALLNSSAATRKALHGAVSEVSTCTNLSSATGQIQNAVSQRSTEYSQASALSASALTNGSAVKSDLMTALRTSLDADRDYLAWAQQQLNQGCTPTAQSSAYTAAYTADQVANAAKEAFVQVWNPVAARYGAQQKSPDSI